MDYCPNDEVLLAMLEGRLDPQALLEVDAHLDACGDCTGLIAALGGELWERAQADQIGRFILLEPIGQGAMGLVYAAFDPKLDRKVALKLLRGERSKELQDRLTREAKAMARLSHANVVTVHDVGVHGDEVFLAMELVEGLDLRRWAQSPRETQDILQVFQQAGEGLFAAHQAGLVHRDFKPENVLVDALGKAKVTDFGLATSESLKVQETDPEAKRALAGTPAYMAPEQLSSSAADARADQYAFCVALWEALCGARPYAARTVRGLLDAARSGPPKPPSQLSSPIAKVLIRGLQPEPSQRFPDMGALLDALKPKKRRLLGLSAVGVALVCAALVYTMSPPPCSGAKGLLGAVWNDRIEARLATASSAAFAQTIAEQVEAWGGRWARTRKEVCEATRVRREQKSEIMERRLRCLDRQRNLLQALLTQLSATNPATYEVGEALQVLPVPGACLGDVNALPTGAAGVSVEAALAKIDQGRALWATAQLSEADRLAAQALQSAERLAYAPALLEARLLRSDVRRAQARLKEAEEEAYEAVYLAQSARLSRERARAWLTLLRTAGAAQRYSQAERFARHADAVIGSLGRPQGLEAQLRRLRGALRVRLRRFEEAEGDLKWALSHHRARDGERAPILATIHTSLGNLKRRSGLLDEALFHHQRALRIDRRVLGEDHPRIGQSLHNVAGVLRLQGRYEEARARYEEALRNKRASQGEAHPEVALTLNSLGLIAVDQARPRLAQKRYMQALEILKQHPYAALVRLNLARLLLGQGDEKRALENARAALQAPDLSAERREEAERLIRSAKKRTKPKPPPRSKGALAPARGYEAGQPWD